MINSRLGLPGCATLQFDRNGQLDRRDWACSTAQYNRDSIVAGFGIRGGARQLRPRLGCTAAEKGGRNIHGVPLLDPERLCGQRVCATVEQPSPRPADTLSGHHLPLRAGGDPLQGLLDTAGAGRVRGVLQL